MEREQEQEEQVSTQPEQTSTETTPTNPPAVESPSIDSTGRALYLQVLGDKNREIERLQRELEAKQKPVEQPLTPEQEQRFFTNPISEIRDLIRSEVAQANAPLLGFVQSLQKNDAYSQAKRAIGNNPVLANLLRENESYVDEMMKGVEPTEANITAAIFQVNGLKAAGLIPTSTPASNSVIVPANTQSQNPVPNQPVNTTIPPHLRPSSPPVPQDRQQPYKKPLDENERRLMRELGMTEEEYRAGQAEGATILEPETNVSPRKRGTDKEKANV